QEGADGGAEAVVAAAGLGQVGGPLRRAQSQRLVEDVFFSHGPPPGRQGTEPAYPTMRQPPSPGTTDFPFFRLKAAALPEGSGLGLGRATLQLAAEPGAGEDPVAVGSAG